MLPRLLLLLGALLFSTGGAAIKGTSLGAWEVAGYRSGIAALTLLALFPSVRRELGGRAFAVGATYAATLVLYVGANKLTTAANAIFLQSTAPLYLMLLAPRLLGERTRPRDVAAMAGIALGLAAFFVGTEAPRASAPNPFAGDLLGAASGAAWALTVLGLRASGRDGAEAGLAPVVAGNLVAFAVCLPFALTAEPSVAPTSLGQDVGLLLYLGVFQVAVAYVCVTRGLREVPALQSSLLLMAEPALNPVWAWLAHGEVPGPWALGGGVLILGVVGVTAAPRASGVRGQRLSQ